MPVPDNLLSRPVYADTDMAELATGNTTVVFGEFNARWTVRRLRVSTPRGSDVASPPSRGVTDTLHN